MKEEIMSLRKIRKKWAVIVLAAIGVALLIFGAVWVTVIFPALNKIPADLKSVTYQQGTVTVFDSNTYQPVTYNVIGTRSYDAVRCIGDVVYLEEDISFIDANTGQEIPSLHSNVLMAIDRVSRANVPGYGDQDREGYWSFPRDVKADQDYPFWITGSPVTLDAKYYGEEDFRGLHVLVFEITTPEEGVTVPAGLFTPQMQLYQYIKMKVEPVSGVTVYFESTTTRTAKIPVFDSVTGEMTFSDVTMYADSLTFTEGTIAQLVHDARFYHWALPWGSTYLPWLVFGLGAALVVLGLILLTRRAREAPAVEYVHPEDLVRVGN
jgi:hypothetical protein